MGATYSSLRSLLRSRTGNRSTDSLPDTRLDVALKAAIIQLASPKVHRHAELETDTTITTADGSAGGATADQQIGRYAIDTTLWTIYSVRNTTSGYERRLFPEGIQVVDELNRGFGQPLRYARWGRYIILDPIPNAIFTVRVRGYAFPTFSVGGDSLLSGSCPFHDVYDEGVLLGGEYRLWYNDLQNPVRGQAVKMQLVDWMDTIIPQIEGELDDQEDVMGPDLTGITR
jgi:hypothetical protein